MIKTRQTSLQTEMPNLRIYYVSPARGSDTLNDGKSEHYPFATFEKAIEVINDLSPSETNQYTIKCLEQCTYTPTEGFLRIYSYVHLFAPFLKLDGFILIYGNSTVEFYSMINPTGGVSRVITTAFNVGNSYIKMHKFVQTDEPYGIVQAGGASDVINLTIEIDEFHCGQSGKIGFANNCSDSVMNIYVKQVFLPYDGATVAKCAAPSNGKMNFYANFVKTVGLEYPNTTVGFHAVTNNTINVFIADIVDTNTQLIEEGAGKVNLRTGKELKIIDYVSYVRTGNPIQGTTPIPYDDTTPQNTEGNLIETFTYTPKKIGNSFTIRFDIWTLIVPQENVILALFRNAATDAVAVTSTNGSQDVISFRYKETITSLDTITFYLRAGLSTTGTFRYNGRISPDTLGGKVTSGYDIIECSP